MPDVMAEYLDKEELAQQLNKHPRTLDRWRRLREGPPITRIGKQIFYKRSSVIEWLAGQEVAS